MDKGGFFMSKKMPMVYGALMLTAVNLLLRFVSTSFQVYLSGAIGPEGVGLLQLVMSVSGLALTAGIAGIRTTAMYLCAEDLGRNRRGNIPWVLTGCFGYCYIIAEFRTFIDQVLSDRFLSIKVTLAKLRHFLQCNKLFLIHCLFDCLQRIDDIDHTWKVRIAIM